MKRGVITCLQKGINSSFNNIIAESFASKKAYRFARRTNRQQMMLGSLSIEVHKHLSIKSSGLCLSYCILWLRLTLLTEN